jgi:uncharacterized DUF497 family protein
VESRSSGIEERIRRIGGSTASDLRRRVPSSITIADPDYAIDEERFVIVGMSSKRSLLIVVHTIRGERIRLISARSATKHERRNYEETSL